MDIIKSNKIKIASILVVILPILNIYKVWSLPLTFADLAAVFIVIQTLIVSKLSVKISSNGFIAFFCVFFVISTISVILGDGYWDSEDFISKWLKLAAYYCVIDISFNNKSQFDFSLMQRFSIFVGVIVSIILWIQLIFANYFGVSLTFFLHNIPLNYGIDASEIVEIYNLICGSPDWRPISIFCEPSHYAQFALMPLAISLFCDDGIVNKNIKNIVSIFLTASILISYSAIGIITAVLLWAVWCFSSFRKSSLKSNIGSRIILVIIIVIGIYILSTTDFLDYSFTKLGATSSDNATSATQRILQGFAVFETLPFARKIFGIGFGNLSAYLIENNITTAYLSEVGNEYMNGFSTVLVSGGIVGLIIFFILWMRLFFLYKKRISRIALFVISILFCSSSMFYSPTSIMYLAFVCCSKNKGSSQLIYD